MKNAKVEKLTAQFKTAFNEKLKELGNKKGNVSIEIKLINENSLPVAKEIELLEANLLNFLRKESWDITDLKVNIELSMFIMIRFQVSV
ncbi:MAG: hypothetical protein WA063_03080 [Minisyncoccia bacterium]